MKTRILGVALATCAVGALVGVAALAQTNRAASAITEVKVPEKVDNFRLVDHMSIAHDLYYYKNSSAIVIVSQVNGSPFMRDAVPAIEALKAKYAGKGVTFFMVNSTPSNDEIAVKDEAQKLGIDIPVLIDDSQLVGENLGVSHVAEAYVINPKTWKVEYHGPIDDRFAGRSAKPKAAVKSAYVADAIDAVMSGAPVKADTVKLESPGIAFPQRDHQADFVKISYANDVAPILAKNCVACHSEGGIAPFAMNSYEMVKGFAPMIREVIRTDRMPPYNADPHIGKFTGDMNLANTDAQTLVHWIEAGAPRGDSAIDPLKINAQPAAEWELGTPDLVLEIPAFKVPASGVVDYQNPIVASPLTEARWIRAVTVKPGDRKAVHHVVGPFSTYAVGGETMTYPEGAGMMIKPGQPLRFQMHYTPYGRETTDTTRVGLYFYPEDKPPVTVRRKLVVANTNIEIPPGAAHHKEVAYVSFPHDATLYAIFVHAHYRGENAHVYLQKPGGKRRADPFGAAIRLQLAAHLRPRDADRPSRRIESHHTLRVRQFPEQSGEPRSIQDDRLGRAVLGGDGIHRALDHVQRRDRGRSEAGLHGGHRKNARARHAGRRCQRDSGEIRGARPDGSEDPCPVGQAGSQC